MITTMTSFREEREQIALQLTQARAHEARLAEEVSRITEDLTHVRARIASLEARDRVYAGPPGAPGSEAATGDLSGMTAREAIRTVLAEARPEPMRLRDLEQALAGRGKRIAGGLSVDLTSLKYAGEVLNPARGYWTVP
jgi:hypothetical protein